MNKFTLLLFVFLTAGLNVQAGFKDGPFVAPVVSGDLDDEEMVFGWQAVYEFEEVLSIESTFSGQKGQIDTPTIPGASQSSLDLQVYALTLAARAAKKHERLSLYGSAGVGLFWFNEDSDDIRFAVGSGGSPSGTIEVEGRAEIEEEFGFLLAAGLEYAISKKWDVFVEYRQYFLETDLELSVRTLGKSSSRVTPHATSVTDIDEPVDFDHGILRIGVNYKF